MSNAIGDGIHKGSDVTSPKVMGEKVGKVSKCFVKQFLAHPNQLLLAFELDILTALCFFLSLFTRIQLPAILSVKA